MTIKLPFARAWQPILHNEHLTPPEKLILIEVCRYWPKCYIGVNATIALHTGFCVRHIQRILKQLSTGPAKRKEQGLKPRRAYIDRGYIHIRRQGRIYTFRMIKPLALPGRAENPPTYKENPSLYDDLLSL